MSKYEQIHNNIKWEPEFYPLGILNVRLNTIILGKKKNKSDVKAKKSTSHFIENFFEKFVVENILFFETGFH